MLSVRYPKVIPVLKTLLGGLWPLKLSDGSMVLIAKLAKEGILAAKMARAMSVYVIPTPGGNHLCAGVVTAFWDDHDEPIILTTPLFAEDPFTTDLFALLSRETFAVHFFDENNYELLGYRARNPAFERFKAFAEQTRCARFSTQSARTLIKHMNDWFGRRSGADDGAAFPIELVEPLFPEDIVLFDLTVPLKLHGQKGVGFKTLERTHAGQAQETDIISLLLRVFPREQVYANPMRIDYPNLEFADVIVVTDHHLYIIQAKDSPNTEAMLRRKMERKRSVAVAQLTKATRQLRGSIKYARSKEPMMISTGGVTHTFGLKSRTVIGLIVLKEMFDADAVAYATPVLKLEKETGVTCVVVDYMQLHTCTLNLTDEAVFLEGLRAITNAAHQNGVFPRLRFGLSEE